MPSINLDLNYFENIKTVRLRGRLGPEAEIFPIKLWIYCGKHHPDNGILRGYTDEEIEAVCGWAGEAGHMVKAMADLQFLIKTKEGWCVKDWLEHEAHLVVFRDRARAAANVRWGNPNAPNTSSIAQASPEQCPISAVQSSSELAKHPNISAGAIEVLDRYKKLKGVPEDQSQQWDVKLRDRMLPYAKNILATCKDIPNAIRCLDQYAREFEQRGFKNWTLKAIDDRAIEWMAQKEGGSREQRASTGQGFIAEMRKRSAVENEDPDHGSFATAGQVFNKPRDRSPTEHPNAASRDERERVAANERSVGRLRTEPLEAKADRREKP